MPSIHRSKAPGKPAPRRSAPSEPPTPSDLSQALLAALAADPEPKMPRDVILELAIAIVVSADTLGAALRSPEHVALDSAADLADRISRMGATVRDMAERAPI